MSVPKSVFHCNDSSFWEAPKSLKHLEMARAVCSSSVMPLLMLYGLFRHGESLTFSLGSCLLTWEDTNLGAKVGGRMRMPLHGGAWLPQGLGLG